MKPKQILFTYLKRIGFNLKDCGHEHYLIQDNNGVDTEYMLWDTTITCKNRNVVSEFKIEDDNINFIDENMLCIGNDTNYVIFINQDM